MKKLFLILMAFFILGVFTVDAEPFTKKDADENVIILSVESDFTLTEVVLIGVNNSYFVTDHFKMLTLETTFIDLKEGNINEDHFTKLYGINSIQIDLCIYTGINPNMYLRDPYINKLNSVTYKNTNNKNIKRGAI